jgi:DNA-binding response OmpR family regulator
MIPTSLDILAGTGVPTQGLRVLHVEDTLTVRETVRVFLQPLGFILDEAESASLALQKISKTGYDLVICDYMLGNGPDGQSLLDKVRREHLVPRSTVFIMLTTERSYGRVAQVVELAPDAYLLKPFTLQELEKRIRLQLARIATLRPVLDPIDAGNWKAGLRAAQQVYSQAGAHQREAQKLAVECMVGMGRVEEAKAVLDRFAKTSETPVRWALWERAKLARQTEDRPAAKERLTAVHEAFPHFVPPTDALCEIALEEENLVAAHLWATRAAGVSGTPDRLRRLGFVEKELGNDAAAEAAFTRAAERGRTSFYGDAVDYALAADSALAVGGKDGKERAVRFVAEGRQLVVQSPAAKVLLPLVSADANDLADRTPLERKAAAKEMDGLLQSSGLDARVALMTAEQLLKHGLNSQAAALLRKLQDTARLDRTLEIRLQDLIERAEPKTPPPAPVAESPAPEAPAAAAPAAPSAPLTEEEQGERAILKNNEAVMLLRNGAIDDAITLLIDALAEMPSHETLRSNLVKALLRRHDRDSDPDAVEHAARLIVEGRRLGMDEEIIAPLAANIAEARRALMAAAAPPTPEVETAAPAQSGSRLGRLFGRR